jgi:perosamine synthetase
MVKKKIFFCKPFINHKDSCEIINRVLDTNFPNEGLFTRKFEKKIGKILKVKYVVATTSGTVSLFLALKANNINYGDEVIIPNITFSATANAVILAGGKPILADVNPDTLLIDETSLNQKISKKTKFIIPVHISGRGSNIKNIIKIAKKNSIKIIEDAAEAFGSKKGKKFLGTFGEAGCFSFAPNKIITTGQGGLIVTNKKEIYKNLLKLKDHGRVGPTTGGGEDKYISVGFNFKFSNLQSALGLSQLKIINWRLNKLKKMYIYYYKNIIPNQKFKIINFQLCNGEIPLWTDAYCEERDELIKYLKSHNIICRPYWMPINTSPAYKQTFKDLPNSKKLQDKMMWLPSCLDMSSAEQYKICNLINTYFKKNK